ncbi:MAG: GspE/PulE family protein [Gallionella sp.]|nr:GspE/PulE family protein [Gallionella sp.]MDD4959132.1 GspE/PulE family protein [Gallionella sp.]
MELTESLIAHFQEKGEIPPIPLAGMIKAAQNDAIEFVQFVIQDNYLDRDTAGELLASQINCTYVNLSKTLFQDKMVSLLPGEIALRYHAIPIYRLGNAVTVGMIDPNNAKVVALLESLLMCTISPVFCFRDEIDSAIKVNYQSAQNVGDLATSFDLKIFQSGQLSDNSLVKLLDSKPLVDLSDSIILLALKERASDIHIEPKKNEVVIRFRIDGVLSDRLFLPVEMGMPLASRYKITAEMDITERRKPQDGKISFALPLKTLDLRVSCLPVVHGEKIVMRILGSLYSSSILNLDKLDFSPEVLKPLKSALKHPQGILFVTGPTGSGKSTSLYAALNYINSRDINIITIEDPVEYDVQSLNQVMVNNKVGRGFQEVLRSVLRQDPDAILVGEIRDTETARIAAQAALTGHLVLTTLHTNDAIQATTRLLEMGVERFIVAPALIGVLGQRLVRRLCEYCKADYQPEPDELRLYFYWREGMPIPTFYKSTGCDHCGKTGYSGRVGIHEFLKVTPQIREAILRGRDNNEIMSIALQQGFHNLRYDGFKKALRGLTSLEEVVRATATLEDE